MNDILINQLINNKEITVHNEKIKPIVRKIRQMGFDVTYDYPTYTQNLYGDYYPNFNKTTIYIKEK